MSREPSSPASLPRFAFCAAAPALCLLCSSCALSPLASPVTAFSSATNLVVNNSTTAYQAVIDIHDQEQVAAGVLKIQQGQVWDPHEMKPLISAEGLKTRLTVLAALKTYAQNLSDLTSGLDSKALDQAAAADGSAIKELGTALSTEPGFAKAGISVGTQSANGVSAAALALGEMLTGKIVKRDLPPAIKQMDPNIQTLCTLLTDDVDTLRKTSKRDYDQLIVDQTVYVRTNGSKLSAADLRGEVEKLPTLIHSEQTADAMLADLHTAIGRLALTHHALADQAQSKDTEALKARIADLAAAGKGLAAYYQGLPTQ